MNQLKKFRNFQCETGAVIERFVQDEVRVALCECGCFAERTISTPEEAEIALKADRISKFGK